jgi:hypothetical protein
VAVRAGSAQVRRFELWVMAAALRLQPERAVERLAPVLEAALAVAAELAAASQLAPEALWAR